MARVYSSTSVATTLANALTDIATSMVVTSGGGAPLIQGSGFTAGDIFTIAINPDTQSEEICYVTANSGDTFTISRGQAGTGIAGVSGIAHASGATVRHVLTSSDLDYFRDGVTTANAAIPASTLTTKGDLLSRTTATLTRLPIGSTNQSLLVDSTTSTGIKWGPSPTSTLTTTGDVLYASAANTLARRAIGATGEVLMVSGGVPVWSAIPDQLPSQTGNAGKYLKTDGSTDSWAVAVSTLDLTFNAQTGTTYTLVATDLNKVVTLDNSSPITLTIPSAIFTTGQAVNIQAIGAGQVTIQGDGTSTFTGTGTQLRTQYSAATIICTGTDTFTILGDLI